MYYCVFYKNITKYCCVTAGPYIMIIQSNKNNNKFKKFKNKISCSYIMFLYNIKLFELLYLILFKKYSLFLYQTTNKITNTHIVFYFLNKNKKPFYKLLLIISLNFFLKKYFYNSNYIFCKNYVNINTKVNWFLS